MATASPPSDQSSGARPISFVLIDPTGGTVWVPLVIRPEDLSEKSPMRTTVVQTLGRDNTGWADKFGPGLPEISITGNTGWRKLSSYGDGEAEFLRLKELLTKTMPDRVQTAINLGMDPSTVRLLFVDTLNSFTGAVEVINFELKRNKNSPLLFRYAVQLQTIDTRAKAPTIDLPFSGNMAGGLSALARNIGMLEGFAGNIEGWANDAMRAVTEGWAPIGATVKRFMDMSNRVFSAVNRSVSAITGVVSGSAGLLINTAKDLAQIGTNITRTIASIKSIPQNLKQELGRVASAYQEVFCIFQNSLKPEPAYGDYSPMFGASNCSSTTGGRPMSAYANTNTFDQLPAKDAPVAFNDSALTSMAMLKQFDPVSHQMAPSEIDRYVGQVVDGYGGLAA